MRGGPLKLLGLAVVAAVIAGLIVFETPTSGVAPDGICAEEFSDGVEGRPFGLTVGPDRKLWFSEQLEDRIGVFDIATKRAREFPVPEGTMPNRLTAGPDGKVWFTGIGGSIGNIDPRTGKVDVVVTDEIPAGSVPQDIVAGPDGKMYVTLQEAGFLSRVDPETGKFELFPMGLPPVSRPSGMALDPDRRHIWIALLNGDALARFDTRTSSYTKDLIRLPEQSGATDVTIGPGGDLFVNLQFNGSIARYVRATRELREYPSALPPPTTPDFAPGPKLIEVIADPNGEAVWVSTSVVSRLFRLDIDEERITRLDCGITPRSATHGMVVGPDGNIWFTEPFGRRLARVDQ